MPSHSPHPRSRRPWAAFLSLAAGVLLAGCGSSTTAPAGAPAPTGAAPDGPVTPKVNRLVMAATPPDRENNDLKVHGMPDVWELRPMYEYLIGVDAKTGKLIPQLATEWQFDSDAPSVRSDRKGTRLNSSHVALSRMPSSA